ncbi:MAG: hypothetical protein PHH57_06140 [Candidatus Omnitrophica bacterium]|nr:hypothetical protein [Candidatus Omnitrophota bacterium]
MSRKIAVPFLMIFVLMAFGTNACSNASTSPTFSPENARVRMWITLSNNPDDPQVTTLTSAQTAQARLWAMGMSEESITFKVNLYQGDKLTGLASGIRTEGSNKAVSAGGLSLSSTPLQPGDYTLRAHTGSFGEVVGVLDIVVTETVLSEQPDTAAFRKYFTELGIGKLPEGGKLPLDLQKNASVFAPGEKLLLYGSAIQDVTISSRYYNIETREETDGGQFAQKAGGFASGGTLSLPPGKYECKVYVDQVLVGVFPFEAN